MTNADSDASQLLHPERVAEAVEAAVRVVDKPSFQEQSASEYGASFIGDYRLVRELGRGGMGVVFQAVNERLAPDRPVALKILKKDLMSGDSRLRFRRERVMLAAVDSIHVPELLDVGTTSDGRPYFVMEFVDGMPLDRYLSHFKLSLLDRLLLFEQICGAVVHVHESLIIHRDIKPTNVFVVATAEGFMIRLLDFGVATMTPDLMAPSSVESLPLHNGAMDSILKLTQDQVSPHTPAFAAPEQRDGKPVTFSADIYALGVILRVMTLENSYDALIYIVEKATQADPESRYEKVAELQKAVADLRSSLN